MRHHATKQPRRLGGIAVRGLFALAVAALPGCGEQSPTGPEEPAVQAFQTDPLATDFTADQSATNGAAAGSAGLTATRLPKSFFVNPTSGKDTNPGTQALPFKTLARGLSSAIAGDTMRLVSGVYSAATNGERFTNANQQVVVPAGVMILGTPAGDFTTQLRGVAGDFVGLDLKGAATVRDLILVGFGTGVRATQGVQSFKNLIVDKNTFGLDLSGSAKTTLVGGRLFAAQGVAIGAVRVRQQAQFIMDGGTISGSGPNCATGVSAVSLIDAARLTMRNGATIKDIAGVALQMQGTSKATLTSLATIDRNFSQLSGCTPMPGVMTFDSTTLTLKKARILSTGGTNSIGIQPQSRGLLTLDSAQVTGHTGAGIKTFGFPRIVASGSVFKGNTIGIDAALTKDVDLTIIRSTVTNSVIGIRAPFFKLRGSTVASNQIGILMTSPFTDLGQTTDPGQNFIINNSNTGVTFSQDVISGKVGGIFGSGNVWNPRTQGSDANGKYPRQVLDGSSPLASGTNFKLPGFNFLIEF
jgi:Protein of unknown function (DUF1565)